MKATTGLGEKLRKAPNTLEKIRTSVAKRIHSDIKNKISSILPQLGHHLKINLRTGTQCQYSPDPQIKWKFNTS
jgi:hypothetical protein